MSLGFPRTSWLVIGAMLLCSAGCMKPEDWNVNWFDNTKGTDLAEVLAANSVSEESQIGADLPPTAHTLHALANILAAQGRDRECQIVLVKTIREYPKFLPAYCKLAELHLRQNRVNEAVATLEAGLTVAPGDAVLTNNLGMVSIIKGEFDQSLAYFTEAAGANPGVKKYRANMGLALGMKGRYQESLALYRQVVGEKEARNNLTIILAARGDTETKVEDVAARLDAARPARPAATKAPDADIVGAGLIGNAPVEAATRPAPAEEAAPAEPAPEPDPIELKDAPPAPQADPADVDADETEIILGE